MSIEHCEKLFIHSFHPFCALGFYFHSNNSNNKGAAIKFMENSKSYVEDCDFRENVSEAAGGAIFVTGAEVEVVDSYFADNSAQSGGAISVENDDEYESDFTMSGCEFTGNTARGRGPAVYVDGRDGGDPYTDGGNNAGDDNRLSSNNRGSQWDCNGINFLTTRKCDKFDSTNVKVRPAFNDNGGGGTSTVKVEEDSVPVVKPNDSIWLGNRPTVPAARPTNAPPTNAPPTNKPFIPQIMSSTQNGDIRDPTILASEVPRNPDRGYFNFDINDNNYGPDAWDDVHARSTDEYEYWKEYKEYLNPDLTDNYCRPKNNKRASPIDLNEKVINDVCLEYHEIRDKPGTFGLTDSRVDIEILKDRLRIQWPKSGWWDNIRGPSADIPKGWGDHFPVTHAELVMPSAHTLNGKRFAAEWQIWLMTDRGRGTPAISMFVDVDEVNQRDNWYFEQAISAWQDKFDENQEQCLRKMRGLRTDDGKGEGESQTTRLLLAPDAPEGEEDLFDYDFMKAMKGDKGENDAGRKLQSRAWNPFHPNMMRSIWFWGYEGSTLTPPCYPFVEWRIIEKPFTISPKQHNRLKNILFNNVDSNCEPTSIHAKGGISVPPRVGDRGQSVHKCDCFDFLSDAFRKHNPRIRDCSDFKRNERPSWAVDDGK